MSSKEKMMNLLPVSQNGPYSLRLAAPALMADRPVWDSLNLRLMDRGRLVKQIKRRGSRQPALLDFMEREGWAEWLEVPQGGGPGEWKPERLKGAVKRLNRGQQEARLLFWTACAGTVVCWRRLEDSGKEPGEGKDSR
jgi:hypothetical protein